MKIALLQMTSGIDPLANSRTIVNAVAKAAGEGAGMVFTPEMSGLLDRDRTRAEPHLHREDEDPVLSAVREAAALHGIWVALGSLAVRSAGDRLANRSFVIDDQGGIRARYDKLHLFDVDLPTGESWRESKVYAAGDTACVANVPAGALGLSVCYDLRFPDLYRALSDAGATLIAVPAAFTRPTGRAHWEPLLRARAIEAGAWVVAAAQTGEHADGRATWGHSMVVDPWGEIMLDMGIAPGLGFADIDPDRVRDVRARIPALRHRRQIPGVDRR
ncbi:carbon-nitrogen hydrolase family protein [Stakelama saccharophila]|uniref:Carbon-nitrogen hydrolase family protein n=1 Tax=Stakelama saccharophila TaxID=3075605 RepID=A0ABZ0B639_9SPHN|nr:carbon-nitrogen hydrolase family protein [Stakelama sp. W311]WNO52662.1 carbon-nitrogen hydrolase family protein [Stakelama sp. W311]